MSVLKGDCGGAEYNWTQITKGCEGVEIGLLESSQDSENQTP